MTNRRPSYQWLRVIRIGVIDMQDEGILQICSLENVAQPGLMPTESLVEITTAYYARKTAGYQRIYSALGANHRFDKIVRIFNTEIPENAQYVVLDDGKQYQIDFAQEIVGQDCADLTLIKVEDYFDVIVPTETNEVSGQP